MKLATEIRPRRDGTVRVVAIGGGVQYEFKDDGSGVLVGDVRDESTLTHLLASGNFYPVNSKDESKAARLVEQSLAEKNAGGEDDDPAGGEDDDPIDPNAPPLEGKAT